MILRPIPKICKYIDFVILMCYNINNLTQEGSFKMKKIFALLLVLAIILSLCACNKKENSLELTLENFEDYFDVEKKHYLDGKKDVFGNSSDMATDITIKGVSTNHIYKNVEFDFSLKAAYTVEDDGPKSDYFGFTDKTIDKTITVKCDVAGNGKIVNVEPTGGYINKDLIDYMSCEIVSVRGNVVEN